MKKLVVLMGLVMGLSLLCVGCGKKEEMTMLTVGTSLSFAPYEYKDENGQIVGIDIDIMQEVAQRMGKRLIVETMEFDDLFNALKMHKIDVIAAGLTVTDERKAEMNFTVPYDNGSQSILVNRTANINSVKDLKERKDIMKQII